ncbi:translocation protein [Corchorus olitorius]|uniref:Translocation protein n=1 Tax=Corchorus olitorius TaxID=93759 RepID=A0A1R3JLJ1_9ROSI|nr:translocation protein [Corchorus olitorius]
MGDTKLPDADAVVEIQVDVESESTGEEGVQENQGQDNKRSIGVVDAAVAGDEGVSSKPKIIVGPARGGEPIQYPIKDLNPKVKAMWVMTWVQTTVGSSEIEPMADIDEQLELDQLALAELDGIGS